MDLLLADSRHGRRNPARSAFQHSRQSHAHEIIPLNHRSWSPERHQVRHRRSPSELNSLSPYSSRRPSSHRVALAEHKREDNVSVERDFLPDRAVDRRTRRHRQAAQEKEISQRKRDGKKPFYLTLDAEGKLYGVGKPAWVAEIGKLAIGLDASCTNIRSQTYEAVTTLKARLNDNFEYSRTLNDDYLRSMMGKAVTKKRGELIALINKGGTQPLHIDSEVWERLVKLAASRQQQEKSEQGRYANACRRSYGRTGSRGINGVRERLREQFNRSPDPEEMEFELSRDKGYGGYKKKLRLVKLEEVSPEQSTAENSMESPSQTPLSEPLNSDGAHAGRQKKHHRVNTKVFA